MALVKCPDCGKEFSEHAQNCPNCGCPITYATKQLIKENAFVSTKDTVDEPLSVAISEESPIEAKKNAVDTSPVVSAPAENKLSPKKKSKTPFYIICAVVVACILAAIILLVINMSRSSSPQSPSVAVANDSSTEESEVFIGKNGVTYETMFFETIMFDGPVKTGLYSTREDAGTFIFHRKDNFIRIQIFNLNDLEIKTYNSDPISVAKTKLADLGFTDVQYEETAIAGKEAVSINGTFATTKGGYESGNLSGTFILVEDQFVLVIAVANGYVGGDFTEAYSHILQTLKINDGTTAVVDSSITADESSTPETKYLTATTKGYSFEYPQIWIKSASGTGFNFYNDSFTLVSFQTIDMDDDMLTYIHADYVLVTSYVLGGMSDSIDFDDISLDYNNNYPVVIFTGTFKDGNNQYPMYGQLLNIDDQLVTVIINFKSTVSDELIAEVQHMVDTLVQNAGKPDSAYIVNGIPSPQ